MLALNRAAIVARPKPPFLEWLHAVDPTSAWLTLTNLAREPTIYLVDECDDPADEEACLQAVCSTIFEDQLDGWWRDRTTWPTLRSLPVFGAGLIASFIRWCSTWRTGPSSKKRFRDVRGRSSFLDSTPAVDRAVEAMGLRVLKTPVRTPQANAFCERVIGATRRECLDWLIPFNERHLRLLLLEWIGHNNRGRPHTSLGPGFPDRSTKV